jgi:hypothetical protein
LAGIHPALPPDVALSWPRCPSGQLRVSTASGFGRRTPLNIYKEEATYFRLLRGSPLACGGQIRDHCPFWYRPINRVMERRRRTGCASSCWR